MSSEELYCKVNGNSFGMSEFLAFCGITAKCKSTSTSLLFATPKVSLHKKAKFAPLKSPRILLISPMCLIHYRVRVSGFVIKSLYGFQLKLLMD